MTPLERDVLIKTALCVDTMMCDQDNTFEHTRLLNDLQPALSRLMDVDGKNQTDEMTRTYCAGLLFNDEATHVSIIRKQKPDWQRGKLNAIGGKIEANESAYDAMVREFSEEAGVSVTTWVPFVSYYHHSFDSHVTFFRAFDTKALHLMQSMTDEKVGIRTVDILLKDPGLIDNLRYIIPMARVLGLDPVIIHDRSTKP